jgi:hypothetical protein
MLVNDSDSNRSLIVSNKNCFSYKIIPHDGSQPISNDSKKAAMYFEIQQT